ncbi:MULTISPECIES: glycosyltransferase family 4 protein [Pseudomonadaceae]|uniref:glycosyltransferase family 4 protein n=1 Tax=Pseudomonadaceae TaxID=135621 RepID=UPI0015E3F5A8|nr:MULTISPECIES: glycosyltransferase family 4 protein [Pseudomonadaceae]MBA1277641.1 glycosyltransferase family 4 protein [Stutzerimonas stutzeri]MBC8650901.1 glycosyltransferase family 4 protein [Pseudomonas sp. MT4]QXY91146.1 glycosyltransferase family 4 protein [Pseudomonas sp. MTM4]
MKILFLHSLYAPHVGGGAEIVVRQLAEGLQGRGCDVTVLATGPETGLHEETLGGVRLYRAGLHNLYWHFTQSRPNLLLRLGWHYRDRYNRRMRLYVREVIAREQPDVVICHNLTGWSISAWDEISAAGVPIVQVLHDLYLLCPKDTMFSKGRSCGRQCGMCSAFRQHHAGASAQVAAVIGVSRFILDRVSGHGYFSQASRHVVHNSATLSESAPRTPRHNHSGLLRFGYIGTLSENKGVGWLIDQFQELSINATLEIAGRGKLDDEAQLKAKADPAKVRFVGYQNAATFMRNIDVLVVPSIWAEPFGLVAVEACAQHLPVIATNMGGLPEIIQNNLNGLLCSPADPDSLGRAMLKLYLDSGLRQRLSQQAHSSVAPFLDMERMLDQYQSILHAALHGRRAHDDADFTDYTASQIEPAGD